MLGNTYAGQDCTIARALEVVGERWTLLVLRDALFGVRRFSDFAEHLDIPRAVLADRLRKLVAHGLLVRTTAEDDGNAVTYELTEAGRATWPIVHALAYWGRTWGPNSTTNSPSRVFLHAVCETRLDSHGHCPECGITPDVADIVTAKSEQAAASRRTDRVSAVLAAPEPHRLLSPI
jgi:DNA-binding HxlR family transcriptional regulator